MKLFQFGPKRGGDLTNGIEAQSVPEPVTDLLSGQGATTESKRMHTDAAFFLSTRNDLVESSTSLLSDEMNAKLCKIPKL